MAIGRIPEPLAGIQEAILDAKGDLISATAADTPARLAVGSNNQILMADSAQSTGLKWAASATSTLTAKGDLLTATAANTIARLGVGADGTTLVADSSQSTGLKWATASSTPTYVGCSLYLTTDQTGIANATNTVVNWTAENFDTDGFHSTSTNTSRITIPSGKAGKYLITGTMVWAIAANARAQTILYKNGAITQYVQAGEASETPQFVFTTVWDLAVGDYIEVYVRQGTGSNQGISGGSQFTTVTASLIGA